MVAMNLYVRVGEARYTRVSPERFYSEWTKSYSPDDEDERKYRNSVGWGKAELTLHQLEELWKWKSRQWGRRFYDRSKSKLDAFNEFRGTGEPNLGTFWRGVAQSISRTGFIYQAFAAHIAQPRDYPMVDQHVLRAHICISAEPPSVVLEPWQVRPNCTSFDEFLKRYEPYQGFWFELMKQLGLSRNDVTDNRRLDTAIRNFGIQLLKDYRKNEFPLQVE